MHLGGSRLRFLIRSKASGFRKLGFLWACLHCVNVWHLLGISPSLSVANYLTSWCYSVLMKLMSTSLHVLRAEGRGVG